MGIGPGIAAAIEAVAAAGVNVDWARKQGQYRFDHLPTVLIEDPPAKNNKCQQVVFNMQGGLP